MRVSLLCVILSAAAVAAPPIAEKTKGFEKRDGFTTFYWDAGQGKVWLEIGKWQEEFLYVNSLPAGIGSNDIGLDRGQLGRTRVVRWERVGPLVMLVESNYRYRAEAGNVDERRAVRESFAESVLWGFDVAAEEGERVLVDATAFFLRDAQGVMETLQRARQGAYRVDATKCAVYLPRTKNFPRNTEIEATVTLAGGPAGRWLESVTPSGEAVTVRQHHSFIALPEAGYTPREFDPRGGYFPLAFQDYSTPVSEPVVKRYIRRHRLQKGGTITYYVDRAAPEPIRTALLEGARWWAQAFEAAGFPGGFRVELMPEDADPMDVRYNVIQWVHRSTRGWSYGASVTDPRTGEIIKGHVTLGSLRARQDFLIAEAFLAPYEKGQGGTAAGMEMVLQRMRQLSAHEVGHTLGLGHNYIASARGRSSVMDYPHPWIDLKNGVPDLAQAYTQEIGEWDKVSIAWGYGVGATGRMLEEAAKRGLVFLADEDARPPGSAHPETHLWDNGANAVDELARFMKVRAAALDRFGENNVPEGRAMAQLEEVLVPLYLSHRYQTEAAVKVVGGLNYRYAVRGDGQMTTEMVAAAEQRRALDAVLKTISAETLTLPERIIRLIPPRPAGIQETREIFSGRTGRTFDPLAAAESAAELTLELLLHPQRAARLVEYHARDAKMPGLEEVIDRVWAGTWRAPVSSGLAGEVLKTVQLAALRRLMALAADEQASGQVRAAALAKVGQWKAQIAAQPKTAHTGFALQQIGLFEKDPKQMSLPRAAEAPPGMPIGQ